MYDKADRHGNDYDEGRILTLQIPRNRNMAHHVGATWGGTTVDQEGQKEEEKNKAGTLLCFLWNGQGRVRMVKQVEDCLV